MGYMIFTEADIWIRSFLFMCYTHNKLTPESRAFLQILIVTQLVKKFPVFYGTRRFITMFKRAHLWIPFWA